METTDETVAITYGEEVFCPRPYQSFRTGPFSMTTKVQSGETPEQAMLRAYHALEAVARTTYRFKRKQFFERLDHINDKEEEAF